MIFSCTLTPFGIFLPQYNAVERAFGWLEQHWRGSLLDSVDTVLRFAESLTFKGTHPSVSLITQAYKTGVKYLCKINYKLFAKAP